MKATCNIRSGYTVTVQPKDESNPNAEFKASTFNTYDTIIGVAARNIKKGEFIHFDPTRNTNDIIVGRIGES